MNKYQEALENLECKAIKYENTLDNDEPEWELAWDKCAIEIQNDVATLEKLIDCQLTVEEIGTIMNCLSVACFDEDKYKIIFEKLVKQKEAGWLDE